MKRVIDRIAYWGMVAAIVLSCGYCVFLVAVIVGGWIKAPAAARDYDAAPCIRVPEGFRESDLVGTWIGSEFGHVDTLVIRADGTYQQVYTGNPEFENTAKFISPWNRWTLEYRPNGSIWLHLRGMRRCDSVESICNNPGGGLPDGSVAYFPCEPGDVAEIGEVLLMVAGTRGDAPRGIVLYHAKLAGSEWYWGYRLQE